MNLVDKDIKLVCQNPQAYLIQNDNKIYKQYIEKLNKI